MQEDHVLDTLDFAEEFFLQEERDKIPHAHICTSTKMKQKLCKYQVSVVFLPPEQRSQAQLSLAFSPYPLCVYRYAFRDAKAYMYCV